MSLRPLGDHVIIKPDAAEEKTDAGIYIATEARQKPQTGTVVSVGEGKLDNNGQLVPIKVSAGDKIVYGEFTGTQVHYKGEDYLVVRAEDIYAVIE
ncbi:MAG: co-chaperone GroES [Eggerthellaceae bacterium]|jgi:chaperonin GroES